MLVRLLFVVLACGVLAVSRVLIVQGEGAAQTPSILSLLPVTIGSAIEGGNHGDPLPSDYGRGGAGRAGGLSSSSLKKRKKINLNPHAPHKSKHSAAALDSLDADGARGHMQSFRKSLRSHLGVYAGRISRLRERVGGSLRSTREGAVASILTRLRRGPETQAGDGSKDSHGLGIFAERLLRQLVNRAQQGASGATTGQVDDRYLHLIRALEVEGDRALGPDEWKPVSEKDDMKVWKRMIVEGSYGREYPCLKLSTVLNAPAEAIMELLVDSDRVAEYNKYSKGRDDVEHLGPATKIVRNRTLPPMQKKTHEFCTIMHVIKREDGSQVMLTRFTDHPKVPRSSNFARSEIILGVTEVRPHPTNPNKAHFTTVSHVKSAGVPAFIAEQFSVRGVVDFVHSLQNALHLNKQRRQASQQQQHVLAQEQGQEGQLSMKLANNNVDVLRPAGASPAAPSSQHTKAQIA